MELTDKLSAIGDAIRSKTGKTDLLTLDQMATEINGITNIRPLVDGTITEITAEDLNGATKIKPYAFYGCDYLTKITIPETVQDIYTHAFYGCDALTEINFNATYVDDFANHYNCFLSAGQSGDGVTVNIGANVRRIPAYLFGVGYPTPSDNNYAKITSVTFAEGSVCEYIGEYAFWYCLDVKYYDFSGCTVVPTLNDPNTFYGIPSTCEIRVPAAIYDDWIAANNWSGLASKIVAV